MKDPGKAQSYLEVQVKTASPDQLLLMLLDGAVRFVEGALERMEKGDREGKGTQLARAGDIVLELVQSLNPAIGEKLYENLVGLYKFIYRRLVDGNLRDDRASVEEGLRILRHVRETWRQAVASWRSEAQAAAAPAAAAVTAASPPVGISLQA
jgi:flagellar protein FliS